MAVDVGRRELILGGAGLLLTGGAWAQNGGGRTQTGSAAMPRPVVTPPQIEGPFYPYDLPAETDWDLVRLATDDAPAIGEVVHVFGTVKGYGGRPYANALVELWQADTSEKYRHPDQQDSGKRDARFQGYGRVMTDAAGAFRFRTIRPPAYLYDAARGLRRAPHKHLAVSSRGVRRLTTQLYIKGEPLNDTDHWLNMVADRDQRASLIRPYEDGSAVERGAKRVHYDIVIIA